MKFIYYFPNTSFCDYSLLTCKEKKFTAGIQWHKTLFLFVERSSLPSGRSRVVSTLASCLGVWF